MQRGTIIKHHGSWALRYYETVLHNGQPIRKKAFKRLAPISDDYPNKRSVLLLAEKVLAPVNTGLQAPESSMSVVAFIENVYLPFVLRERAPATYKNYKKDLFEKHLKGLLCDVRLRDFRTIHGQRILRAIPPPKDSSGRTTLVRAKAFLSSVFKHAKREGFLDGENPMRDTSVPGRPVKPEVRVYEMDEIVALSAAVGKYDLTAFTAIAVAAFAGLRQSEIRGLRWSDYDGTSLKISRSVWRTHIGPPKTEGSVGVVPVLPFLQSFLNEYRAKTKFAKDDDYIFSGERRGAPLNLANLVRRVIIPSLVKAEEATDQKLPEWRGWHSFRRSLATNLYSCGVSPKVIQAIMRHSDIGTTLQFYVRTPDDEARAALQKIDDWIKVT